MIFNYKGLEVTYNEKEEDEQSAKDFIDTLFEDYYEELKKAKKIDISSPDYIKVDSDLYTYEGGRLYLYDADEPGLEVANDIDKSELEPTWGADDENFDNFDEALMEDNFDKFRELADKLGISTNADLSKFARKHNCKNKDEIYSSMQYAVDHPEEESKSDESFYETYLKNMNFTDDEINILVNDYHMFDKNETPYDIDNRELAENIKMLALDELQDYITYLSEQPIEEFSKATFHRPEQLVNMVGKLINKNIKEDLFDKVEKEDTLPESFEGKMDFLAEDEQEAIDGYKKVIDAIDDEHVKEQLNKIMIEEEAHKAYLEKVKEDKSIEYTEPLEPDDEDKE